MLNTNGYINVFSTYVRIAFGISIDFIQHRRNCAKHICNILISLNSKRKLKFVILVFISACMKCMIH